MRLSLLQFGGRNIVFFVFVGVALVALLFGLGLLPFPSQTTMTSSSNIIVEENAHQGTSSWKIPSGKEASMEIQAYAGATSVLPGQTLTFYVSTQKEGTPYSIDVYRLGWYGGYGGRLMTSKTNLIGSAQGYFIASSHHLVGCISCRVDARTGLVEANWLPSYTLAVPDNWTTGIYLAKFTDTKELQTYVPFDVRGNLHSLYIAVTPDTTYEAYNLWGGVSLYYGYNNKGLCAQCRAVKVSFDRPYLGDGSAQVLQMEADAIHWLERQGYDLSYISDVDLHKDPSQLLQHRAYLSLGHDEYWTKEMRDGVEYARNHGIGLAFLGANAVYWQIRFEPDSAEVADRTIVCYKVETGFHNLVDDPIYGKDNTRLTAQWRDPALNRPENALIGIMYSANTQKRKGFAWQMNPLAKSPLLQGTGLQPGKPYGCDVVGYEWDRIFDNGATPAGLHVLGVSPTVNNNDNYDVSDTSYYIAQSGAMVFATGSIDWTTSLDSYRYSTDNLCIGQEIVVPGMQVLMAHVMDALIIHHPYSG